jgi:hypothetical protein
LTVVGSNAIIVSKLIEDQRHSSALQTLFSSLTKGKSVVLRVNDPRLMKKKRITDPLLFITPVAHFNVLVSMPGYGSELIDISKPIRLIQLMRLGLNAILSRALGDELTSLYERMDKNG